jgi:hypothetical protein
MTSEEVLAELGEGRLRRIRALEAARAEVQSELKSKISLLESPLAKAIILPITFWALGLVATTLIAPSVAERFEQGRKRIENRAAESKIRRELGIRLQEADIGFRYVRNNPTEENAPSRLSVIIRSLNNPNPPINAEYREKDICLLFAELADRMGDSLTQKEKIAKATNAREFQRSLEALVPGTGEKVAIADRAKSGEGLVGKLNGLL